MLDFDYYSLRVDQNFPGILRRKSFIVKKWLEVVVEGMTNVQRLFNSSLGAASGFANEIARLPFHYRWSLGCQLSLAGVAPFVPMLPVSAQHTRGPVAVGNPRSSVAAGGHWLRWQRS